MSQEKLARLREIILRQSFQYRQDASFKLTSGAFSHFYFDCKKTTLDPEGAYLIGELLFERVSAMPITGAGGLTLGADPLAAALMHAAWRHGRRINQFIVRKELKGHGAVKWIEGVVKKGDSVIVLDDVVTTGGSAIKAVERAREDGLNVYGVMVLVDREEFDGLDKIRQSVPGRPAEALITRSEIMAMYEKTTRTTDEQG